MVEPRGNSAIHLQASSIKENGNNLNRQLGDILEREWSTYIYKISNMLMGILMSQTTKKSFYLQELQHSAHNVEHCFPFDWRYENGINNAHKMRFINIVDVFDVILMA